MRSVVIDAAIVPKNFGLLILILLLLVGGAISLTFVGLLGDFYTARFGVLVSNNIRYSLFERIQSLSMEFFGRRSAGDIVNCFLADVEKVENSLSTGLAIVILDLSDILFSAIFLFSLNWQLAVLSCIGLTFCILAPAKIGHRATSESYLLRQEAPDAIDLPHLSKEICFDDVSFSYSAERGGIQNLSLKIRQGDFAVFVGHSGAGKSTIVNLLTRLYDPDSGCILFDGIDVRQATVRSLRSQIGLVSQEVILFNSSVRENIRMGCLEASDEQVETAAKAAEIHDFILSLPHACAQAYQTAKHHPSSLPRKTPVVPQYAIGQLTLQLTG